MQHTIPSTPRPAGTTSVLIWGLYLLLLGTALVLVPARLFTLFQLPYGSGFGERMLGVLTLVLGLYYVLAAVQHNTALYRWKLYGHALGVALMSAMILVNAAPPSLLSTAAMDVLAGAWTWRALRRDARNAASTVRAAHA